MEWATPSHSKKEVNKAGKYIVSKDYNIFEYIRCLEIVNNWRASHSFPLNTFQNGLRKKGRAIDSNCLVAQRIKRLSSIENKLQTFSTMTLSQMQDIGGCRAVLTDVSDVIDLCDAYLESRVKHKLHHVDNYIEQPKNSGYRGVHLIYRYFSDRKETYNSLLIEIQLRSQMQHAWATAVETVGIFAGQALKSSRGEEQWLRFFALAGTLIAGFENSPPVPNTPIQSEELLSEIRELSESLDVVNRLEGYNRALQVFEENIEKNNHFYLIVLIPSENKIRIRTFAAGQSEIATAEYLKTEKEIKSFPGADSVLVSVDSLNSLRRAYPNYFADTKFFVGLLKDCIS